MYLKIIKRTFISAVIPFFLPLCSEYLQNAFDVACRNITVDILAL